MRFYYINRIFKIDSKIKTVQNRKQKRKNEHLSKSEPPRFGQRQVFCYKYFYNEVLQLLYFDFKMDTKSKTAQNRILNMKKGGIWTPSVRFEMWKIRIV